MTDAAASRNFSEETKRVMEMLRKTMNSACYIYVADFRDLVELHEAIAGKELAESVDYATFLTL